MLDTIPTRARKRRTKLSVLWLDDATANIQVLDASMEASRVLQERVWEPVVADLVPPLIDMQIRIFDTFARTIRNLPPGCILKILDLECQTLRDDVEKRRFPLPEDAAPIFYFNEFIKAVREGRDVERGRPLRLDQVEFFRETVARLVQANELPQSAIVQFEDAFVNDIFD